MRPITGTDIIAFYNSGYDLLVRTADGALTYLDRGDIVSTSRGDNRITAYDYVTTEDGAEVQVLLEVDAITDGDWFPDALDDDGNLIPSVADEMADIINSDGILPGVLLAARFAREDQERAEAAAREAAQRRARAVAEVVEFCGGNQSEAARLLGLDQSTVNKLVKKVDAVARA